MLDLLAHALRATSSLQWLHYKAYTLPSDLPTPLVQFETLSGDVLKPSENLKPT